MFNYFLHFNPIIQSLIGGLICFILTLLGSSTVFLFNNIKRNIMNLMTYFSLGIMLSSAIFSLLIPSIQMVNDLKINIWINIMLGFILGALLIFLGNNLINYYSSKGKIQFSKFRSDIMLFCSITLHNIPEGLVLGVAFGSIAYSNNEIASLSSALVLTIGIAIQNFFEGSAVSLPFKRNGISSKNSFLYGALSGVVEPISALFGVVLVLKISTLLPFIMSFTASAMLYVVIMELSLDNQKNRNNNYYILFLFLGFSIMMLLELIL